MTNLGSTVVAVNPSASNPPVSLVTGIVPNGNGLSGPFLLGLGNTAYTEAAMTTVVTGAPASCSIQLQGSMDGTNWVTLATSTSTTGDTIQVAAGATAQFNALRANVSAVSGGTSPTIAIVLSAFASLQGSVVVVQGAGNANSPWRVTATVLAPSVAGAGSTAAAPTAGTSITTATAGATGTYLVEFAGGFGATAENTQLDNIGVKVNATFKTAIPLANVANTMSQPYIIYLSLTAADQVSVYVINNGSAGSIYKGFISITQVG